MSEISKSELMDLIVEGLVDDTLIDKIMYALKLVELVKEETKNCLYPKSEIQDLRYQDNRRYTGKKLQSLLKDAGIKA